MFARAKKEKDEADIEIAARNGSQFNLDAILQGDGSDALTNSSFRNGNSSKLFGGSHRRRRIKSQSFAAASHAIPRYTNNDFIDHNYYSARSSTSSFPETLVRKLSTPFLILVALLFWGPIMMLSSKQSLHDESKQHLLPNLFSTERRNLEGDTEMDLQVEPDLIVGNTDLDAEMSDNEVNTGKGDEKIDSPILKALLAVQSTDFRLPEREQDADDKFDPENLSEDERKELQITVKHRIKSDVKQLGDQSEKSLAPLRQYQLRTQQEEERQLKHYEDLKRHDNDPKFEISQEALHKSELRKTELEISEQNQHRLQQEKLKQQQLELSQQLKIQQDELERERIEIEKLHREKIELEKQKKESLQRLNAKPQNIRASTYKQSENSQLIPEHFETSLANIWDPILPTDTALFFHIPKSGGTTVADILTHCLDLVSASNVGATEGHGLENKLEVRMYKDKGRYVNVNPASIPGIKHAKELGLASSGLADVVVLHRLHEGSELFDANYRGRLFCIFRNPIHRAISMFYYLRQAKWEPTYDPTLADMTLLDYVNSNKVEENWVTRFLVHQYTGRLTSEAVDEAKAIMRNKMLVGLLGNFQESLKRFELYFNWWESSKKKGVLSRVVQCQQDHARTKQNKVSHPIPDERDPAYQRLLQLNWADMELYLYAGQLFNEQAELVKEKNASLL